MIGPALRARAEAALAGVERDEGVRVLLAVESGSRAWGFPSPDSDYDVRFVFVRPLAGYLRVAPMRDVIERPAGGELDLGGWDLRKTLALLVRSNAVALEWLSSPVVYRQDEAALQVLGALAHAAAHLPALAYHYDRLARRAWSPGAGPDIRLKSCCYALRPALALLWMRSRSMPPPMDLPSLMAGVPVPDAVARAIHLLLSRKAEAVETATMPRDPVLEAFLAGVLARREPRPDPWDVCGVASAADTVFRRLVLAEGQPAAGS